MNFPKHKKPKMIWDGVVKTITLQQDCNGATYSICKVGDDQNREILLFLFADAFGHHCKAHVGDQAKLRVGTIVQIKDPESMDTRSKAQVLNKLPAYFISRREQLLNKGLYTCDESNVATPKTNNINPYQKLLAFSRSGGFFKRIFNTTAETSSSTSMSTPSKGNFHTKTVGNSSSLLSTASLVPHLVPCAAGKILHPVNAWREREVEGQFA
jgi:hypothetical protein